MKVDRMDLKEMSELLQVMMDYSWVTVMKGEYPVKTEDLQFYSAKSEIDNSEDYLLIPLDVLLRNLGELMRGNPRKAGEYSSIVTLDDEQLLHETQEWVTIEAKAKALSGEIKAWGIPHDLTRALHHCIYDDSGIITLETGDYVRGTPDKYILQIGADVNGNFHIDRFLYEEKKEIKVVNTTVGEINSLELDKEMSKIDWNTLSHSHFSGVSLNRDELFHRVQGIVNQLITLSITGPGKIAADQLAAKYWVDTSLEQYLWNKDQLQKQFVLTHEFVREGGVLFTMQEAYNLMHGRCVCKEIEENEKKCSPWFYMIPRNAEERSKLFRIPGSESLNVTKIIEEKRASGVHFDNSDQEIVAQLKKGETVHAALRKDWLVQPVQVWFDATTSRLKAALLPVSQETRRQLDEDLRKGRSI